MYADDTTIYFNLEDFPALNREQEINKELEKLNVDKTKYMFFHKRRAVPSINLSMNNIPIDIVLHISTILVSYWISIYRGQPMLRWSLGNLKKIMVF